MRPELSQAVVAWRRGCPRWGAAAVTRQRTQAAHRDLLGAWLFQLSFGCQVLLELPPALVCKETVGKDQEMVRARGNGLKL